MVGSKEWEKDNWPDMGGKIDREKDNWPDVGVKIRIGKKTNGQILIMEKKNGKKTTDQRLMGNRMGKMKKTTGQQWV